MTSPNLHNLPLVDADTSRGKQSLPLDLTQEHHRKFLLERAKECDVFLQAYRPGGLESKGFGVKDLINMRPGIVCANITAYGFEGPWKDRRGVSQKKIVLVNRKLIILPVKFDSLVQAASGIVYDETLAYQSFEGEVFENSLRPLPMQALDHGTGYLITIGINIALARTITVSHFLAVLQIVEVFTGRRFLGSQNISSCRRTMAQIIRAH